MDKTAKHFIYDLLLVVLCTYGIFYTSYKFGRPDLGNQDFFKYAKMVDSPMNMAATRAPFVLRQLPTMVAYAIKEAGVYYPNQISFINSPYYTGEESQRNLFALILSNYLAVVAGLILLIRYLRKQQPENEHIHFTVLALCLGYFMLQLNIIAPLTQGYGWLATVLLSIGLLERKYLPAIAGMLIALFSRETVVVFFAVFSAVYWVRNYRSPASGFARNLFLMLTVALAVLIALRLAFTSGNANQLSVIHLLRETASTFTSADYLFQAFFTQGLLAYLCICLYRKSKPATAMYLTALLVIVLIGGFGVGRMIGESYPLLVILYCLPVSKLVAFTRG